MGDVNAQDLPPDRPNLPIRGAEQEHSPLLHTEPRAASELAMPGPRKSI